MMLLLPCLKPPRNLSPVFATPLSCIVFFQTNVIEAAPDCQRESEKEWYFGNADKERLGPYSYTEVSHTHTASYFFYSIFLFGVGVSSFQSPCSRVLCFYLSPFSFMSFLITSLHLSFGLAIFQCPSSIFFSLSLHMANHSIMW